LNYGIRKQQLHRFKKYYFEEIMRNVPSKKVKGNVEYSNDSYENNNNNPNPNLKTDKSLQEKESMASSYKKKIRKKQKQLTFKWKNKVVHAQSRKGAMILNI